MHERVRRTCARWNRSSKRSTTSWPSWIQPGAEYAAASDRLHHIDTEFRNRDGYAIEAQVGTVLDGLGFRKEDWSRRTEEFSGGWQMRIALAKLLLEKPNLLLARRAD